MIFLDFEVFKYDWMVHCIDVRNKEEVTIVNDEDKLREYYGKNTDRIWVGFNIKGYDQYIFKGLLLGIDPWYINNKIINEGVLGWKISDQFWKIPLIIYDVFVMGSGGLKKLEGFMGHNIIESDVDFRLDRPLTDDEIVEVIDYCKYDVEQTIEVFLRRITTFNSKMDLVREFNLPISNISKTNAQLSAIVLGAIKQPRRDDYNLNFPKELDIHKYNEVVRWYQNPVNHNDRALLEIDVAGVPHIFRWGGVHGARPNYIEDGNFVLVDIASYYPSLMIEYNYHSRNISNPEDFEEIRDERYRLRDLGDDRQEAYKLTINTAYGCMGAKFNDLYDPLMRNNVCVTGQLFILDMLEKFEEIGVCIIQSNTDGILLKYNSHTELNKIKSICDEWSERTRLDLDYEYYHKIIQKDVNNYIVLGDDKDVFVGDYVKDLHVLDYDLPIINKAIRNYFIDGIPVEVTINSEDRLREFQRIVTVSRNFECAEHNGIKLTDKTLRIFASKNHKDGRVVRFRTTKDGEQRMKFANTSDNSFIDNGYIVDKQAPDKLDKQWYIDLANRRINQFKGVE